MVSLLLLAPIRLAELGNPQAMTFDGTHIHIADNGDDNVRMILPPSADGQAPIVYTYTVSGLGNPGGMAFDGTHIHITDFADDNVRMILPPSSVMVKLRSFIPIRLAD